MYHNYFIQSLQKIYFIQYFLKNKKTKIKKKKKKQKF
jgi:hypothetical protein